MAIPEMILLYDGACPLCRREVESLGRRDGGRGAIRFVDVDDPLYDPDAFQGISYREAMGRVHGITADGRVLRDLAVFQEAYRLVGLGWIYAPVEWPVIGPLAQVVYRLWARLRLRITGRPDLDTLCVGREAAACRSSPVASS
jgi:predicted DCC family thiol-disulfide oxidoreductase YuxK